MSNELIPDINSKGVFTLKPPFSALMPPETRYSVKGIRKISEIIASAVDVFSIYYQANGLSQSDYDADVQGDVSIVSLSSEIGQWLYVPTTYIAGFPDVNGVVYTSLILGVSLGSVADITNLGALKTSVRNLVRDYLGVLCEIKEVIVSTPSVIPYAQHQLIENARDAIKANNMSDRAKLIIANDNLTASTARIVELENYIKTKLP